MIRIVCISASNIKHAGENSTSLKACRLIAGMAEKKTNGADTEIIRLADFELKPCTGCGNCFERGECVHDDAFKSIYRKLCKADALFIVSAHYAPIPAKLAMPLEKIEQPAFLKRFRDDAYRSPLYGKPVGIVGHGGGTEEIHRFYQGLVVDSIFNALSWPVEMNAVGAGEKQPRGVTFPVKAVKKTDDSIFPAQEYDWEDIETRLEPLVGGVIEAAIRNTAAAGADTRIGP